MLIRLSFCCAPLLAIALAVPAAAQSVGPGTVVASVNGVEITAGHLQLLRQQLPQQYQALPDDALYEGLLEQAVNQALLAQEQTDIDARSQAMLDNQERAILAGVQLEEVAAAAVTPEALQAEYAARYAESGPGTEYNAAHILVATEDEAAEIKTLLDEGADFAQLARERSTGPSGPNGGELGWFSEGMMVPPFEAAVFGMEPGQVSDPVQTDFGWHVIRLSETRLVDVPTLEEVEDELGEAVQQQAVEAYLADLAAGAEVSRTPGAEIDTGFLSSPDLFSE